MLESVVCSHIAGIVSIDFLNARRYTQQNASCMKGMIFYKSVGDDTLIYSRSASIRFLDCLRKILRRKLTIILVFDIVVLLVWELCVTLIGVWPWTSGCSCSGGQPGRLGASPGRGRASPTRGAFAPIIAVSVAPLRPIPVPITPRPGFWKVQHRTVAWRRTC